MAVLVLFRAPRYYPTPVRESPSRSRGENSKKDVSRQFGAGTSGGGADGPCLPPPHPNERKNEKRNRRSRTKGRTARNRNRIQRQKRQTPPRQTSKQDERGTPTEKETDKRDDTNDRRCVRPTQTRNRKERLEHPAINEDLVLRSTIRH